MALANNDFHPEREIQTLCVYCGSSDKALGHQMPGHQMPGHQMPYLDAARQMGALLAANGIQLVYGAGSTGMMGVLANEVLEQGGSVVGVIPAIFNTPQLAHTRLTRLEVVEDMHRRKARLAELADAFIALPGGFGTLDEFFEILTWAQIGLHRKPIGLLNTQGYFDPLLAWVEHARAEGFIYPEHRALFVCDQDPSALLDLVLTPRQPPSNLDRWITRKEG